MMQAFNQKNRRWRNSVVILLVVALAAWVWQHMTRQNATPTATGTFTAITNEPSTTAATNTGTTPSSISISKLAEFTARLDAASDANAARPHLAGLRATLAAMPANEAVAQIRKLMDSRADAPTRLGFKLAAGGRLETAPTLRTFLLDELAQIDPAAAAEYAKVILASQDSPDEWAVALRAYARGNSSPDATSFLQQKIRELLDNKEWRDHPSVGFLEAFDVIVHTRDKELTAELGSMIREKNNRALAHAAYLTLDRLVQAAPTDFLGQLQAQPEWMDGHERTRADFFARADVRDAQQRALLENYLLDGKRSGPELQQFAGIFPNANYMVSHNLLTQTATPTGAELAARDRAALDQVEQWLEEPRFAKLRPQLQTLQTRLQQFVPPAGKDQP